MKKKILSLVLVVAMLASMLVFAPSVGAAAAGTTAEISVGKVTATAGGSVDVDIVVTSTEPVYAFNFAVDYDKTKLSLPEKNAVTFDAGGAGQPDASGAENAAYAQTSPYRFIAWTTTDVNNPADATNGWVAATLHFDVAEDAIGDVVVSVCNTPVTFISRSAVADDNQAVETLTYASGVVSVLPEGYVDASTVEVATTSIGMGQYQGKTFSMLILEEGVADVGMMGVAMHAVDLKIIVLGNPTFQTNAIAMPQGKVTICAAKGTHAESYAASNSATVAFEELTGDFNLISLTVGTDSYLVPAETTAPGVSATADGKVVVGWSDGTTTYAPGAAMTLTEDTTLNPVTIDAIQMNTEVGFMLTDKITTSRMRYTTDMKIADYNKLAELGTVTLGTIITPAKYVSMAGGLTKEALTQLAIDNVDKIGALPDGKTGAGLTYIDVPASAANPFGKTADIYTFAGSLAGFKAENIDLAYAAAFYATVELADGSSFTIYSAFDFGANRAVGATVEAAKAKAETKELKKAYDDLIEMIKANTSTAN